MNTPNHAASANTDALRGDLRACGDSPRPTHGLIRAPERGSGASDDGQAARPAAAALRARAAAAPHAAAIHPQSRARGDRHRDRATLGARRGPARCCSPRKSKAANRRRSGPGAARRACQPARRSTPGSQTDRRSQPDPARAADARMDRPRRSACSCAARAGPARAISSKRSATWRSTTARPSRGTRSRRSRNSAPPPRR